MVALGNSNNDAVVAHVSIDGVRLTDARVIRAIAGDETPRVLLRGTDPRRRLRTAPGERVVAVVSTGGQDYGMIGTILPSDSEVVVVLMPEDGRKLAEALWPGR